MTTESERRSDREYEELREEVAGRVVFDPDCRDCLISRHPIAGSVIDPQRRLLWIVPCAACAERRPHSWVHDIPIDALRKFLEEQGSGAVPIEALRPLVPPKRGFEFL